MGMLPVSPPSRRASVSPPRRLLLFARRSPRARRDARGLEERGAEGPVDAVVADGLLDADLRVRADAEALCEEEAEVLRGEAELGQLRLVRAVLWERLRQRQPLKAADLVAGLEEVVWRRRAVGSDAEHLCRVEKVLKDEQGRRRHVRRLEDAVERARHDIALGRQLVGEDVALDGGGAVLARGAAFDVDAGLAVVDARALIGAVCGEAALEAGVVARSRLGGERLARLLQAEA
mmetsp:Transcript_18412/g.62057  ORF Transcript_18412/g.62057 Transcript_18412/m.62057 type:complete len:234 (-) Transcript_18412:861-1562(-)